MAEIKEQKGIMTPPGELIVGGQAAPKPERPSDGNKVSTFEAKSLKKSLQKLRNKKQILKEEEENGLLSEKNIKP